MSFRLKIVLFLVSAVALIVAACGNNPEKTRVFMDSSNQAVHRFSDNSYISASGKGFRVNKNDKSMEFFGSVEGQSVEVRFQPDTRVLQMNRGLGAEAVSIAEADVNDGFKPLLDELEKVKMAKEVSGEGGEPVKQSEYKYFKASIDTLCSETRPGEIVSVYTRPNDLTLDFGDYYVKSTFESYSDAQWVMHTKLQDSQGVRSVTPDTSEYALLAPYLKHPKLNQFMLELCDSQYGYDSIFQSFFTGRHSNNGGAGVDSFNIPVAVMNDDMFKLAGFLKKGNVYGVDDLLFTVNEEKVDVRDFLRDLVGGNLEAGQYATGDYDETTGQYKVTKQLDKGKARLNLDFEEMTFGYDNLRSEDDCRFNINGKIDEAYFSTRRNPKHKDLYVVKVRTSSVDMAEKCYSAIKAAQAGQILQMMIGQRSNNGEISLTILDESGEKALVSAETFVK